MDLFHKIIDLIDKNSDRIPEGDYLELCDTIQELRRQVKPPSFLLDQNQPLWMGERPSRDFLISGPFKAPGEGTRVHRTLGPDGSASVGDAHLRHG